MQKHVLITMMVMSGITGWGIVTPHKNERGQKKEIFELTQDNQNTMCEYIDGYGKSSQAPLAFFRYILNHCPRGTTLKDVFEAEITPDGLTFLHVATQKGKAHLIDYPLKNGIVVDRQVEKSTSNYFRWTSLHIATQLDNRVTMNYLIAKKADINKIVTVDGRFFAGYTSLHIAAENNRLEALDCLIANKADLNEVVLRGKHAGYTALHIAVAKNHFQAVKKLVEAGADINAQILLHKKLPYFGYTPLHIASMQKNSNIIKYLIENGADITLKTTKIGWLGLGRGETAYDLAKKAGGPKDVLEILKPTKKK